MLEAMGILKSKSPTDPEVYLNLHEEKQRERLVQPLPRANYKPYLCDFQLYLDEFNCFSNLPSHGHPRHMLYSAKASNSSSKGFMTLSHHPSVRNSCS